MVKKKNLLKGTLPQNDFYSQKRSYRSYKLLRHRQLIGRVGRTLFLKTGQNGFFFVIFWVLKLCLHFMCEAKSAWLPSMWRAKSAIILSRCKANLQTLLRPWKGAMQTLICTWSGAIVSRSKKKSNSTNLQKELNQTTFIIVVYVTYMTTFDIKNIFR